MKYKNLFIWGPNPLNNRLLARHIHSFSGITPKCLVEFGDCSENDFSPGNLFFCDCDKADPALYCRKLHRNGFSLNESPAIALLNVSPDLDLIEEIKHHSIQGIFYASDHFDLIEKGIKKILDGEYWLSREMLVKSLQSVRVNADKVRDLPATSQLTVREREILRFIAAGLSNQAIAERIFISPNTVKTHISNIYKKIDATNRVQAILWATECLPITATPQGEAPSEAQTLLHYFLNGDGRNQGD